jgi:HAD superfamily hydrolase (TIGR01490 family)
MADAAAGRVAAIFDVDNTLLPGTTSERLFIRFLLARRQFGLRAAVGTVLTMARHARLGPFHALRQHRPYLRGWSVAQLEALGEEVVATQIAPRLAPCGVSRVHEHQAAGHLTALLSGSLPFLLAPLSRRLGIDHVIATPLAIEAESYTGSLAGAHPYGEEKALRALRFADAHGVDLARSFAYADHHTDARLLSLFGHPVCVNPNARLRRVAARCNWPVERWGRPKAAGGGAAG